MSDASADGLLPTSYKAKDVDDSLPVSPVSPVSNFQNLKDNFIQISLI
jgi:hypothetical protein